MEWIRLSMDRKYHLEYVRILQPLRSSERMQNILVSFSDGSSVEHRLENNQIWKEVMLSVPKQSTYVNISRNTIVHSNKGHAWHGILEIQAIGCLPGMPFYLITKKNSLNNNFVPCQFIHVE